MWGPRVYSLQRQVRRGAKVEGAFAYGGRGKSRPYLHLYLDGELWEEVKGSGLAHDSGGIKRHFNMPKETRAGE